MNLQTASVDTVCDALLDGGLSESQRWSLDRRMVRDPELADAVTVRGPRGGRARRCERWWRSRCGTD